MPRKLKTYRTSIGFFDLAVAAPSMKAALDIWGADSNLFHQGFASETDDPAVVAATAAHPGEVLRRPVGSSGAFKLSADLPQAPTAPKRSSRKRAAPKQARKRKADEQKEERKRARQQQRRAARIEKAEQALQKAERQHDEKMSVIQAERDSLDDRERTETDRWAKQRNRLDEAVRKAKAD